VLGSVAQPVEQRTFNPLVMGSNPIGTTKNLKQTKMQKGKIIFTGNFWEYFFYSIGLLVLSTVTFGLMFPYYCYWSIKYFVNNLEIEMY
jgi:uncharacterized membrane protein YjgN (DUF898 family)